MIKSVTGNVPNEPTARLIEAVNIMVASLPFITLLTLDYTDRSFLVIDWFCLVSALLIHAYCWTVTTSCTICCVMNPLVSGRVHTQITNILTWDSLSRNDNQIKEININCLIAGSYKIKVHRWYVYNISKQLIQSTFSCILTLTPIYYTGLIFYLVHIYVCYTGEV